MIVLSLLKVGPSLYGPCGSDSDSKAAQGSIQIKLNISLSRISIFLLFSTGKKKTKNSSTICNAYMNKGLTWLGIIRIKSKTNYSFQKSKSNSKRDKFYLNKLIYLEEIFSFY